MINKLQDKATTQLISLISGFLDGALTELPAKITEEYEGDESASRTTSVSAKDIEADFVVNLNQHFTRLDPLASSGLDTSSGSLFANLALVDHDDLEENIVIDSMVARCNVTNETVLRYLNQRIKNMSSLSTYDSNDNPIRPRHIATSFEEAVGKTDLDMQQRIFLYHAFNKAVMHKLNDFYKDMNEFLKHEGVLSDLSEKPAIKKYTPPAPRHSEPAQVHDNSSEQNDDAIEQLNQLIGNNSIRDLLALSSAIPALQTGQSLHPAGQLTGMPQPVIGTGLVQPIDTPVVDQTALIHYLSQLQQSSIDISNVNDAHKQVHQIKEQWQTDHTEEDSNSSVELGQENESIIDIVSMLFEFIFDDPALPDEFKAQLGRLQIPILKIALFDKDFLDNSEHPARQLINSMAKACVGWTSDSGTGLRDKVAEIVTKLTTEFDEDISLFDELNQDFIKFYDDLNKRANLLERRVTETEVGKAQQEEASLLAQHAIIEIIASYGLPDDLQRFLEQDWHRLLTMVVLRAGHNSSDWHEYVKTGHDLIALLHPVSSKSEVAIHKLQAMDLMSDLIKGLNLVGYDELEFEHLEQMLTAHYEKIRQGKEVFISKPAVNDAITEGEDKATGEECEASDQYSPEQGAIAITDESMIIEDFEPLSDELILGNSVIEQPADSDDLEIVNSFEAITFDDDVVDQELDSENQHEPCATAEQSSQDNLEQYLSIVKSLKAGSWFSYMAGETELRIKLAAVLPTVGKYIFVNNSGQKVSEYRTEELARAFCDKTLAQIDDSALFERALKDIVTIFKDKRQQEEQEWSS